MSEWFKCDYCHGPADIEGTCPRCAELKRLEREIGRRFIGIYLIAKMDYRFDMGSYLDNNGDSTSPLIEEAFRGLFAEREGLIARWRQLHAAGNETAPERR